MNSEDTAHMSLLLLGGGSVLLSPAGVVASPGWIYADFDGKN